MKRANTPQSKQLFLGMLCVSILMVPGCGPINWIKEKLGVGKKDVAGEPSSDDLVATGEQLVSMDGKRIISVSSLDHDFDQLLEENPQLKSVLPLMPDARYNFLQGMVSQAVVDRYVEDRGLDKTADYQRELAQMMRSVRRMLNTKYFGQANPVEVTDAEVRQYYEDNKATMPDLLVSRGGVKAEGVSFESEAAAKSFAAAVKGKDMAKVAKEQKVDARWQDFKLVNEQSMGMNATLKNKIVSMTKVPATEVVKVDDKTFWVVRATDKQEEKYRSFEQVQAGLKQYVEKERRMAMFDKEITRLKQEYKIVINEDYFKNQQDHHMAQADEMTEMPGAVADADHDCCAHDGAVAKAA